MANLRNIQYADTKTGQTFIGRVVRGADLYYFDFVTGGNTFLATDVANTRISMPARSSPQDYIYESATFDIEPWDDGYYEWQVYDTIPTPANGKLFAVARYYISGGKIMFDDYLVGISTGIIGIKAKTDNLPTDPTSETNATTNKNQIITEVNNNEVKIDIIDDNIDAIKAKTDNLPTDPTSETNATANTNSIISEINDNEIKIDDVKSDTSAIKLKTDNLPSDPTSETNATANKNEIITEIDDNEVKIDAIKTDTVAIKLKTDNLPIDPASQSGVETAISNAEANLVSLLNDISDAIGDIVPGIFARSISDTAVSPSFEYYIRYTSKQVG